MFVIILDYFSTGWFLFYQAVIRISCLDLFDFFLFSLLYAHGSIIYSMDILNL